MSSLLVGLRERVFTTAPENLSRWLAAVWADQFLLSELGTDLLAHQCGNRFRRILLRVGPNIFDDF